MAQRTRRASVGRDDNILSFAKTPAPDSSKTALNLVYQAAEVFSSLEDHARETEARAQSLLERLKLAERRAEAAERERNEAINETDSMLEDAYMALEQAQSRIEAAEDKLTAMEFRAQASEAVASEAKRALAVVEDAIRNRLRKPGR
jgi:chromosome condensin MukBEF complex kleisin-like MukF subunit